MIRSLCGQATGAVSSSKFGVTHKLVTSAGATLGRGAVAWIHNKSNFTKWEIDRGPVPELPDEPDPRFSVNAFIHHGTRPRHRNYPRFDSPWKKANKWKQLLQDEAVAEAKAYTPDVWKEKIDTGDAIEIKMVSHGGKDNADPRDMDTLRGVVLGVFRKKMDYSVGIRDVLNGEEIERLVPLNSPLVKSVTVLEKDFVFRGRKQRFKHKLYFLRDMNPIFCSVTPGIEKRERKARNEAKALEKKKRKKKKKKKKDAA